MREKVIEQKLFQAVRRSGGLALKLVSPGFNGVPDRLLLFTGGRAAFCEVKAPGQKPRPLQLYRMDQLRKMGFRVFVVDSEEKVRAIAEEMKEGAIMSTGPALANPVNTAPSEVSIEAVVGKVNG